MAAFPAAHLRREFDAGLAVLNTDLAPAARDTLIGYLELLVKWNRAFNLTAVRDPSEMVGRHLLDSLAILPYVADGNTVDVGAGAGLPGIPLAVARSDQQFTLIDSNGKKTRFLFQAISELGLDNVDVVHSRVEDYRPATGFQTVVSRAVASIADLVVSCRHLLVPGGRLLAMKGEYPAAELASLPPGFNADVIEMNVSGVSGSRHLIRVEQAPDADSTVQRS